MTLTARTGAVAILAFALLPSVARTASASNFAPAATSVALCKMPLTKAYTLKPGFCPQQIAAMIPQAVSGYCSECCGPFGIPPIYVAGESVMVRQTLEAHEQIAKFLEDLGAYTPPQPAD